MPSPGGPLNSRWSTGSPALPGAVEQHGRAAASRGPARRSPRASEGGARRRTRGPRARAPRPRSAGRRTRPGGHVGHRPTLRRASRSRSSASRAVGLDPGERLRRLGRREAERDQGLADVDERPGERRARRRLRASLSRRSSTTRWATFFPTPGTTVSASASPPTIARRIAAGCSAERKLRATFGPDPVDAGQQVEQRALVDGREPVQGHRVLAHDHAGVDARATARRREAGEHARRGPAARTRPPRRRRRRRCRPSRRPSPSRKAIIARPPGPRCRASGRPAGGSARRRRRRRRRAASGTSRSPWTRASACCTCRLSALPIPVTACFTSFGPYSSTSRPASAATSISGAGRAGDVQRAHLVAAPGHPLHGDRGRPVRRRRPRASPSAIEPRAAPLRRAPTGVRTTPAQRSAVPTVAPGDHGEPASREPGIDPEDHRIEHLFAAV